MRILNILDNIHIVGGAQNQEVLFVQALQGRGHEVTVISLADDADSPLSAWMEAGGARVVHFPGKSLMDTGRFWRLYRFIKNGSFDIIHTHLVYSNILGNTAGWLTGTKVVTTLHNERITKRSYYAIKSRLETFLLRHAAAQVIACGYSAGETGRARLKEKPIRVVPNGVAIPNPLPGEVRAAIRTRLAGDPTRPLLITIGRLTQQKGYDVLLDAFAKAAARFPEAKLLIVGTGSLQDALKAQMERLGLENQVELLGARTDVEDLLAASDIYVNSSRWEGLSKALLEAMAAGLAIVATRVGDASWVVGDSAGCLVPPESVDALADAMISLLAEPAKMRAYGGASRERAIQNHEAVAWSDKLLDVYRDAISLDHRTPGEK